MVYVSSMSSQGGGANLSRLGSYGASKRVSEILLERAIEAGFAGPCSIIRPGMIGMSEKGALSPSDTVTLYCRTLVQLKAIPSLAPGTRISLCSVQDVAQRTVQLLESQESHESVNIAGPGWTTTGALSAAAQNHCITAMETIPYAEFVTRVQQSPNCALHPLVSLFTGGRLPMGLDEGDYESHNVVVPITDALVALSFEWMARHSLF